MRTWLSSLRATQIINYFLVLVCITTYHLAHAQNITEGRVAFYSFSGNAHDLEGSNHGTVFGATPAPDRFGNTNSAFYFDGINDYIEIPDHSAINFAADEDFSVAVWVKVANAQNDMGGHNNEILGKWNAQITSGYPYAIRYWNTLASPSNREKAFTLRYDSRSCNNNPIINSACLITTEIWHHLVFLKKGNQISFFQDGVLQESVTDNTSLSCNTRNNNPVYVGKRDTDRRYFTGYIDDISFYNRAISSTEIKMLFEEGQWTAPFYGADLLSFSFPEQNAPSKINKNNKTVEVEVPCGTDLTKLIATFTTSDGATAYVNDNRQNSGYTPNDFTQTLTYTIVGEDGCSWQEWDIIVNKEEFSQEETADKTKFLSFSIPEQTKPAFIDDDQHAILVEVNCSAVLTELVASFSLAEGAKAEVSGQPQKSGSNSNNFSDPLIYQVKNNETCAIQSWTVTVSRQEISAEFINIQSKEFFIPNIITPNGDGFNDTFDVASFFIGSELKIFNRHGKRVSHYRNYSNQFNGEGLSPGTYYYHFKNPCLQQPIKGYLLILK